MNWTCLIHRNHILPNCANWRSNHLLHHLIQEAGVEDINFLKYNYQIHDAFALSEATYHYFNISRAVLISLFHFLAFFCLSAKRKF